MHLAKSIQKLRRWYSVKKEIGRPSANEQNCVGKCTTFRDQTLNFLIDKHIVKQYKGCGLGVLITNQENEPEELFYLNDNITKSKLERIIKNQNMHNSNHIYFGEVAAFAFNVTHQLMPGK